MSVFDRNLLFRRRHRASDPFLLTWAKAQIDERLSVITREFQNPFSFAPGSDPFTADDFWNTEPALYDLITSHLCLHTINDLPGALIQIKRALKADGVFIGALFGGETLKELRESLMQTELSMMDGVSPRVFPFADKQDMGALMQRAGFALPVVDSETLTVTYDNAFKLMHDLRGMGESNVIAARDTRYVGRDFFTRAAQYYHDHFAEDDGRIVATFEVLFCLGWSPHESQQKPLQPGSAKNRLADALETTEIKAS